MSHRCPVPCQTTSWGVVLVDVALNLVVTTKLALAQRALLHGPEGCAVVSLNNCGFERMQKGEFPFMLLASWIFPILIGLTWGAFMEMD